MNKILLSILLFACVISTLKAQIYTPSGTIQGNSGNNNVGIGTTNPAAKLDIVGDMYIDNVDWSTDNALRIREGSSNTYGAFFKYGLNDLLTIGTRHIDLDYVAFQINRGSTNVIFNGNVGIGTTNPVAKLDIVGDMYIDNVDWSTDNALRIREGSSNSYGAFFKYGLNDLLTIGTRHIDLDYVAFQIPRGSTNVTFNGNVGIGTINPTSKLTVAGDIHSREVKVTVNAGADFVFEKEYNLPTLDSVDKYIKENKHLPEIASAAEMKKDGINLSEMNIKLLQKVEEMTLYMIEQNKRIEKLEKENIKK
jgi:hypothetical protein